MLPRQLKFPARTWYFCLCQIFVLYFLFVACASASPPRAEAAFTAEVPVVDGRLGDEVWAKTKPVFFPASAVSDLRSEVRLLWAKEGVYVSFRTIDKTPVFGHIKSGEPLYQEDAFELFIDQSGDYRQFYEIQVSPTGQVFIKNHVLTADPRLTPEGRLDQPFVESQLWRWEIPVPDGFQIAGKFDEKTGVWTMEMFLPAAFVNRRRSGVALEPCTWRINLARHDWDKPLDVPERKGDFQYWAPVLPGHPHLSPTLMGWLELKNP